MPKVKIICKQCGKEFEFWTYGKDKRKFCSKECHNKSMIGQVAWNKDKKMPEGFGKKVSKALRKAHKRKKFGFQRGHPEYRTKECIEKCGENLIIRNQKLKNERILKFCLICKKGFYVPKSGIKREFCSRKCRIIGTKERISKSHLENIQLIQTLKINMKK